MDETDLSFLGAQSLLANGSVEVAKGAGIVALVAEEDQKPVLVCCETFKFNDRSAINALDNHNELGNSRHLARHIAICNRVPARDFIVAHCKQILQLSSPSKHDL